MQNHYAHTFRFDTPDSQNSKQTLHNILSITQEQGPNYYIEYMQYAIDAPQTKERHIHYRYQTLKVDRRYFLEAANITLGDQERRERFFAVLGRRRFGANDDRIDTYFLNPKIDSEALIEAFRAHKKAHASTAIYFKEKENPKNHFKFITFQSPKWGYFVFLRQYNISTRRALFKYLIVEMDAEAFAHFESLSRIEQKIDTFFYHVGKIYFKSLPLLHAPFQHDIDIASLVVAQDIQTSHHSAVDVYAMIEHPQTNRKLIHEASIDLYNKSFRLLHYANEAEIEHFCIAVIKFNTLIKHLKALEHISSMMAAVTLFAQEGKLGYLLHKEDPDLYDVFTYVLELFHRWSTLLSAQEPEAKTFARLTVDISNALKHLIHCYLQFTHDYKIKEAHQPTTLPSTLEVQPPIHQTSAQEFLANIEDDIEMLDELGDLDEHLSNVALPEPFTQEIKAIFLHFFAGYAKMLNGYYALQDLGYSLMLLNTRLHEEPPSDVENLTKYLYELGSMLIAYKEEVFIHKSAESIHFMDDDFYAIISRIDVLLDELAQARDTSRLF
ncbi:MAG: hypothetical protein KU37_05910 [Sulfuricurvum sp. PC08-66]|nr:MAG: hypothetical protein KU37_05910 [Sulfuricurvum sp. PC08-66]